MIPTTSSFRVPVRGMPLVVNGRNPDSTADVFHLVWGGGATEYPWPVAAAPTTLQSTDAEDGAGGAGSRLCRVLGMDANGDLIYEDVLTDGLTPVTLTLQYFRVNEVVNMDDQANVGEITVQHGVDILRHIGVGRNISEGAMYSIPRGYGYRANHVTFGTSGHKEAEFDFFVRPIGGPALVNGSFSTYGIPVTVPLDSAGEIPQWSDLWVSANIDTNNDLTAVQIRGCLT